MYPLCRESLSEENVPKAVEQKKSRKINSPFEHQRTKLIALFFRRNTNKQQGLAKAIIVSTNTYQHQLGEQNIENQFLWFTIKKQNDKKYLVH